MLPGSNYAPCRSQLTAAAESMPEFYLCSRAAIMLPGSNFDICRLQLTVAADVMPELHLNTFTFSAEDINFVGRQF